MSLKTCARVAQICFCHPVRDLTISISSQDHCAQACKRNWRVLARPYPNDTLLRDGSRSTQNVVRNVKHDGERNGKNELLGFTSCTTKETKLAYAAKLKTGPGGRAWTFTCKIKELSAGLIAAD